MTVLTRRSPRAPLPLAQCQPARAHDEIATIGGCDHRLLTHAEELELGRRIQAGDYPEED